MAGDPWALPVAVPHSWRVKVLWAEWVREGAKAQGAEMTDWEDGGLRPWEDRKQGLSGAGVQRGFPGGPVAKTTRSQCRGPGFDPWSGTRFRMPQLRPGTAK